METSIQPKAALGTKAIRNHALYRGIRIMKTLHSYSTSLRKRHRVPSDSRPLSRGSKCPYRARYMCTSVPRALPWAISWLPLLAPMLYASVP